MKKENLITSIEIIISILFIYTATDKITHFSTFQIQFAKIPFVYATKTWIFSYIIVLLEVSIPVLFLFNKSKEIASWIAFSLLFVFTSYLISKVIFKDNNECSCGGIFNTIRIEIHIILNITFLLLSLLLTKYHNSNNNKNKYKTNTLTNNRIQ